MRSKLSLAAQWSLAGRFRMALGSHLTRPTRARGGGNSQAQRRCRRTGVGRISLKPD